MKSTFITTFIGTALLCLAGSTRISAGTSTDPCSLVSQNQISAALGMKASAGKHIVPTLCEWNVPGQPVGSITKKITLAIRDAQAFGYARTPVPGNKITKSAVSGIGDEAVFGTLNGRIATLHVKKGDFYFAIQVYGFPVDQLKEKEKNLALAVLANL